MAKKESSEGPSFFKATLLPLLKTFLDNLGSNLVSKVEESIDKAKKRLERGIITTLMLIVGFIFIVTGIAFLVKEYTGLSQGWSFFSLGLIFFLISLLYLHLNKDK